MSVEVSFYKYAAIVKTLEEFYTGKVKMRS